MMLFTGIKKTKIVHEVTKAASSSRKEIRATMLLREEVEKPLPKSYHMLLKKKLANGVVLKRLGFGTREDYNTLKAALQLDGSYQFRYNPSIKEYQRMIIIDEDTVYFSIDGLFYNSTDKRIVATFIQIFEEAFGKGKNA